MANQQMNQKSQTERSTAKGKTVKRRRGGRKDAHLVKVPGLQTTMAVLMPKRTENEVYANQKIDATNLMAYLEEKNKGRRDDKITIFHCFVTCLARLVREREKLNYFIKGYRVYERDTISISFIVKRKFMDGADEEMMVYAPGDTDTIEEVSRHILGDVSKLRREKHNSDGVSRLFDIFAKLPRILQMMVVRLVRILDFWGKMPAFLLEGDPMFATILVSNLGSIRCPSVYHHLSEFGTNSILLTIGTLHKEELLMEDGSKQVRDVIDIGATLDERIADGFYFAKSLKLIEHIFAHPQILDQPIGKPSGFLYD